MDQETEKIISESFLKLPPELRKAIAALPLAEITQNIATKNNLHIDQSGKLYTETLIVLLGIEKISDFENNVRTELEIESNVAQAIVNDLNEKVFKNLRMSLQDTNPPAPLPKPPQPTFNQMITPQKAQVPLKASIPSSSSLTSTRVPIGMEKVAPIFKPQAPVIQPKPFTKSEPSIPAPNQQPNPTTPVAPVINQKAQIPSFEIKQGSPRPWEVAKKEIAQGFVGGKLTQTVALPTERTVITTKQPQQNQTPQKTDPYREITQ